MIIALDAEMATRLTYYTIGGYRSTAHKSYGYRI